MSDSVIGTAVLDRTTKPERLHILCVYKDGQKIPDSIPVYAKGTQPSSHPAWSYAIVGTSLSMSPSVRVTTKKSDPTNPEKMVDVELFHNDGAWTVPFQEFIPGGEYVQAYDLFRALNPK